MCIHWKNLNQIFMHPMYFEHTVALKSSCSIYWCFVPNPSIFYRGSYWITGDHFNHLSSIWPNVLFEPWWKVLMCSELVFGFVLQFYLFLLVRSVFSHSQLLIVHSDHTLNLPACATDRLPQMKGLLFFMHGLLVKCSNYIKGNVSSTCFEMENDFYL